MKFWDSSAILPLLVQEQRTDAMIALIGEDPAVAVWWLTPVECWSALARLEREQRLTESQVASAATLLDEAARRWTEVAPVERVRDQAPRLLRLHALRAADALQLSGALVFCDFEPRTLPLVTLDERLAKAARLEGFTVLGA